MSGLFGGGSNSGGIAGGLPTGVKLAAMALLAHQLMKHARAEGGTASAGPTSGGGLGGILGGLLGQGGTSPSSFGTGGGGLSGMLGGLLDGLRGQGLGRHVDSWVAPGENHPVAPHELENAFEPTELDEAARHPGTDCGSGGRGSESPASLATLSR
jgi:uncharacterized protein YidB (DUF937 family)